jgi:hypothetical protein
MLKVLSVGSTAARRYRGARVIQRSAGDGLSSRQGLPNPLRPPWHKSEVVVAENFVARSALLTAGAADVSSEQRSACRLSQDRLVSVAAAM